MRDELRDELCDELRDELFWFDFQGNSFVNVVWQSRDGRMTVASKILILKGIPL